MPILHYLGVNLQYKTFLTILQYLRVNLQYTGTIICGLWLKIDLGQNSLNRLGEYIDYMCHTLIFDDENGKVWVSKFMKHTLLMYDIEKEAFSKKMYSWNRFFVLYGTFEESLISPELNDDGEGDSGLEEVVNEDFNKSVEDQSIGKSRSEPSTSSGVVSESVDGKALQSLDAHDCLQLLDESDRKHDERLQNLIFDIKLREEKKALFEELLPAKDVLVEPFRPLTDDEEKMVENALFVSSRRKPCLKDEVINLYMELLKQREKELKKFLECHFFNTFFYKKLKCEDCGEVTEKETCGSLNETVRGAKKGTTNLMQKCKFCKREGTITMIPSKGYPLTINLSDTGKHAPLMLFDCMGFEPLDFAFSSGWKAESLKGTKFVDIELAGGEFAEYDEKGRVWSHDL